MLPRRPRAPVAFVAFVASVAFATVPRLASAGESGAGVSLRGYGGILSADSSLGVAPATSEPEPLRNVDLQAKGIRPAAGFGSELFVVLDDVRIGFDVSAFFSDAYRLEHNPLANGFTTSARSAVTVDFDVFVGRSFPVGPVRPYIDLRIGGSLLQETVRLEHPAFGFLGGTQYNAVRFMFGPRTGVLIPIAGPLFLDVGSEVSLLGYSRLVGFAGFAVKLGKDERGFDMKGYRPGQQRGH